MPEHDEQSNYLALELLSELKATGSRQSDQIKSLHKVVMGLIVGALMAVLAVVAGFLWYLNQYDFTSSESTINNATGVYTLVDSEGNVVASDLSEDFILEVMENGESEFAAYCDSEED